LLSLLLCASVIRWAERDLAGISDSAITVVRSGVKVDWQNGAVLQNLSKDGHLRNATLPLYDRTLLLHGSKRNEVLSLAEIEQYGLDSFGNTDYVSIYGMPPREWYRCGIRLLGRTAVECTRDPLGDRIGRDVASVAACIPSNQFVVIDPFAGSCNTLFWILRHLPHSEGIAFESDPQVFDLTCSNLAALGQRIEVVHGDYERLIERFRFAEDRGIVVFVAPPWGTALDEVQGLDLNRTAPPISEVVEQVVRRFSHHKMLFAIQVYEKVSASSLDGIRTRLDWTELRIYDINERGRNHGVLLGSRGWKPPR
jgi:predicted RNA methylase